MSAALISLMNMHPPSSATTSLEIDIAPTPESKKQLKRRKIRKRISGITSPERARDYHEINWNIQAFPAPSEAPLPTPDSQRSEIEEVDRPISNVERENATTDAQIDGKAETE